MVICLFCHVLMELYDRYTAVWFDHLWRALTGPYTNCVMMLIVMHVEWLVGCRITASYSIHPSVAVATQQRDETSSGYGCRTNWEEKGKLFWCVVTARMEMGGRLIWSVPWTRKSECLYFVSGIDQMQELFTTIQLNEVQSLESLIQPPCIERKSVMCPQYISLRPEHLMIRVECRSVAQQQQQLCCRLILMLLNVMLNLQLDQPLGTTDWMPNPVSGIVIPVLGLFQNISTATSLMHTQKHIQAVTWENGMHTGCNGTCRSTKVKINACSRDDDSLTSGTGWRSAACKYMHHAAEFKGADSGLQIC